MSDEVATFVAAVKSLKEGIICPSFNNPIETFRRIEDGALKSVGFDHKLLRTFAPTPSGKMYPLDCVLFKQQENGIEIQTNSKEKK